MPRLTISLTDRHPPRVKGAAARQQRSMGSIIEESLVLRGLQTYDTAERLSPGHGLIPRLKDEEATFWR